jgi:hypothetical protein
LDSLDELREDNPKEYRKLINSLKEEEKEGPESTIELDKWYAYFRSLNKIPEKYKTKIDEINKIVKNMENSPTFCELDYKITSSEIMKAISKLQLGKAVGLDSLPNEILKSGGSGGTILVPILQKLFNLIFTSGIYPSKWSSAYLFPIFKSSDPSKPENYRGIAINSCIGKLFNSILNKRLDKYLETHNIINPCQIGFTSKSRTSDHMFVLQTLIDKYNSGKGGKCFACFVDFKKKTFDKVIHSGIKYKLLKYNISGHFYKILSDMYSKSQLCVKIGNYPGFQVGGGGHT